MVAGAPRRRAGFAHHPDRPVVQAHRDIVGLGRFDPFLDFIAGHHAADRTRSRRDFASMAGPDLIAENTAHHRTADRADSGAFAAHFDLAGRLDHTAFRAFRVHRGSVRRRRGGDAHGCRHSRLAGGLRVAGGLRGLGRGLCSRCGVADFTRAPDRRRNPSHQGRDAGGAEHGDRDARDPHHRVRRPVALDQLRFHADSLTGCAGAPCGARSSASPPRNGSRWRSMASSYRKCAALSVCQRTLGRQPHRINGFPRDCHRSRSPVRQCATRTGSRRGFHAANRFPGAP